MADETNHHEIWGALSHQVEKMGLLAPEVMPQAALDLASLAIGYAVALGVDGRALVSIASTVALAQLRAPSDAEDDPQTVEFQRLERLIEEAHATGVLEGEDRAKRTAVHWLEALQGKDPEDDEEVLR